MNSHAPLLSRRPARSRRRRPTAASGSTAEPRQSGYRSVRRARMLDRLECPTLARGFTDYRASDRFTVHVPEVESLDVLLS